MRDQKVGVDVFNIYPIIKLNLNLIYGTTRRFSN